MFKEITVTKMARPGKMEIHQACSMRPRPSSTITPQEGVGGGIPTPMKLSDASSTITKPTCKVANTKIDGARFGSRWGHMIVRLEHPATRARATNSCCFRLRVSPRTSRA